MKSQKDSHRDQKARPADKFTLLYNGFHRPLSTKRNVAAVRPHSISQRSPPSSSSSSDPKEKIPLRASSNQHGTLSRFYSDELSEDRAKKLNNERKWFSGLQCLVTAVDLKFPPYFIFGAATSDYQVEGGWNADGKTESVWDRYLHNNPGLILNGSNGDVAADSYNKWEDDVAACADLGLHFYSGLQCLVTAVDLKFPPYFIFGAATSDYQVEGGWNADGKTESVWDRYLHNNPGLILNGSNGDVAADSYNKWEDDVAACADLGLHFYRFSISWTRILPNGFSNQINPAGVKYYNNLIDALLKNNIKPMVTLYHWTLPQRLQDLGGWSNPLIVDWFASYAEVVFSLFADRVKLWITINEPASFCDVFYTGKLAPGFKELLVGPFICNRHVLLAHAKVWRIYDEQYKSRYHGRVSLANHIMWFEPLSKNMTDLTDLAREALAGRYSHPIYSEKGGWPPIIEEYMAKLSRQQGFKSSRLPAFTNEEIEFIKGTYDFYALNFYTSRLVRKGRPGDNYGYWFVTGSQDLDIILESDPKAELGAAPYMPINPRDLRKLLMWLKKTYGDMDIIITENGYSNAGFLLEDDKRIKYIHDHLNQILLSIKEDNVNVTGYTYWSLLDNFEWMEGFRVRFGLYQIDFSDPELQRIPRKSAGYYASIIKSNTLLDPNNHTADFNHQLFRKNKLHNDGQSSTQSGRHCSTHK